MGIVEVTDSLAVSTFSDPPIGVTKGRGLVLWLEATETVIPSHHNPLAGVAVASAPRLAVLCPAPIQSPFY